MAESLQAERPFPANHRMAAGAWVGPVVWMATVLVFLVSSGALHKLGLQTTVWALLYAGLGAALFFDIGRCLEVSVRLWWLWLLPILSLVSVFWSLAPEATFKMSLVFLYTTLMAVWIGLRLDVKGIFTALLVATAASVVASLLVNGWLPSWAGSIDNTQQVSGVFLSKNVYGRSLMFLALAIMVVGYSRRYFISSTLMSLLLAWPILSSESSASLLMYGLVMTFPALYFLFAGASLRVRWLLLTVLVSLLLLLATVPAALDFSLSRATLDVLGKDSTLTGRTELWDVGRAMVEQSPLLGVGFESFWKAEGLDARDRLLSLYGELITGFHNLYLETLVGTGLLGLALLMVFMFASAWSLVGDFHRQHSAELLGALFIWGLLLVIGWVEIVGFRGNSIFHLLLISMVVSSAVRREYDKGV